MERDIPKRSHIVFCRKGADRKHRNVGLENFSFFYSTTGKPKSLSEEFLPFLLKDGGSAFYSPKDSLGSCLLHLLQ